MIKLQKTIIISLLIFAISFVNFNSYKSTVHAITGNYFYTENQSIFSLDAATNDILCHINPNWSDYDKALYAYDWLRENVIWNKDDIAGRATAYCAIIDRKCVCAGFAAAFQYMMIKLGIECNFISSMLLNHAWNLIKLDGNWYYVDATQGWFLADKDSYYDGHKNAVSPDITPNDWIDEDVGCDAYTTYETDNLYFPNGFIETYGNGKFIFGKKAIIGYTPDGNYANRRYKVRSYTENSYTDTDLSEFPNLPLSYPDNMPEGSHSFRNIGEYTAIIFKDRVTLYDFTNSIVIDEFILADEGYDGHTITGISTKSPKGFIEIETDDDQTITIDWSQYLYTDPDYDPHDYPIPENITSDMNITSWLYENSSISELGVPGLPTVSEDRLLYGYTGIDDGKVSYITIKKQPSTPDDPYDNLWHPVSTTLDISKWLVRQPTYTASVNANGKTISYLLDNTNNLTVTGTGNITPSGADIWSARPEYAKSLSVLLNKIGNINLILSEGVTDMTAPVHLQIADTITSVHVPSTFDPTAFCFYNLRQLSDIYYNGSEYEWKQKEFDYLLEHDGYNNGQYYTTGRNMHYTKATAIFNSNGGTAITPVTVAMNSTVNKPADPTRNGYDFEGWFSDEACTTLYNFDMPLTKDINLYAGWSDNGTLTPIHTVTFNYQYLPDQEVQIKEGNKVSRPADPTYRGKKFTGWYVYGSLYDFDTPVTYDMTIHSRWESLPLWSVTVRDDDFSIIKSENLYSGEFATKPADPVHDGYKFTGWFDENGEPYDFNTPVTGNTEIIAKYEKIITYVTIAFDVNGGTPIESQKIETGNTPVKPADPTKNGYTFAGWYKDKELSIPYDFAPVNADTTVYAKWETKTTEPDVKTYTVSFNSNNGSETTSQTVSEGDKATKPASPVRDGYKFTGWFTDDTCTTAYDFDTPVTGNLVLYAGWEKIINIKTAEEIAIEKKNNEMNTVTDGACITMKKLNVSDAFEEADNYETIRYVSSDKSIATVSKKGVITAKKSGQVTITLQYKNGKSWINVKSVTYEIVLPKANKISSGTLYYEGQTYDLHEQLKDNEDLNPTSWSMKSSRIASVDSKTGIVTVGTKEGSINAYAVYGSGKNARKVKISLNVKHIKASKSKISVKRGKSAKLKLKNVPDNESITWNCNSELVTISRNGKNCSVQAGVTKGKMIITATPLHGKSVYFSVTVK